METLQAIAARHSTRAFRGGEIPEEVLMKILDAGRRAPTARNEQPWEFVLVTDREKLRRIGGMTDHGGFIAECSACILVYCRDTKYYLEDGCAATENMLLAATDRGVESCWVAGDKKPYCAAISGYLGVPAGYRLVSLVALGYERESARPKVRRPLEKMVHRNGW
ncbi:MAG TPA: nitroreductase family protein [Kiritimatiellae bacterium]|nr:nitroreductase family protein [Kiritimatiellia bacterium]